VHLVGFCYKKIQRHLHVRKSFLIIYLEAYIESVFNILEPVFDHMLLAVLILQYKTIGPCREKSNENIIP